MTPHRARAPQQRLGFVDQRAHPTRRVLLGERHVVAVPRRAARRAAPRRAASARAGRAPPARPASARRPAGRARCLPRRGCGGASRCRPDRTSLRRRPRRSPRAPHRAVRASSARSGTRNGMPACADLALGAHQALAHRGRRDQEGRRDRGGVEAEHGLQDQRRANAGVDRRMRAGEHQREALVGNLVAFIAAASSSSAIRRSLVRRLLAGAPPPRRVDRPAPRDA